jgi:ferrous iron transport protein A
MPRSVPLEELERGEWAEVDSIQGELSWVQRPGGTGPAPWGNDSNAAAGFALSGEFGWQPTDVAFEWQRSHLGTPSSRWPGAMTRLHELLPGQRGRILMIEGSDHVARRLQEMGLLEGDTIEVLALAPLGDPMEVRVGDSRLSIRKREAQRVIVSDLSGADERRSQ